MISDGAGEVLDVRAMRRLRNTHDVGPVSAQHCQEVEVAGVVHQHGVPGLNQEATHQVDRMRTRVSQHDLVGAGLDTSIDQSARQQLSKSKDSHR